MIKVDLNFGTSHEKESYAIKCVCLSLYGYMCGPKFPRLSYPEVGQVKPTRHPRLLLWGLIYNQPAAHVNQTTLNPLQYHTMFPNIIINQLTVYSIGQDVCVCASVWPKWLAPKVSMDSMTSSHSIEFTWYTKIEREIILACLDAMYSDEMRLLSVFVARNGLVSIIIIICLFD